MRSQSSTWIELERDVQAVTIPGGDEVTLPEGTKVIIQQELGDQFTLRTQRGHLVRIETEDADAIGREPPTEDELAAEDDEDDDRTLEEKIEDQLHTVYDPEIPVDVVELGLIYGCDIEERDDGTYDVQIDMTLTAPGCGMGDVLAQDARKKVESIDEVNNVDVQIVFDPPWTPERMSDEARLELGFM